MTHYINDEGTWKDVTPFKNNDGTWKEPNTFYVNDNGTWKEVYVSGPDVTNITIDGNDEPNINTEKDYTVTIDYSDGSSSSDCTKLSWSIEQLGSDNGAYIVEVTESACTVDVGNNYDSPDFILKAEADNGEYDEFEVDVVCFAWDTEFEALSGNSVYLGNLSIGDKVNAFDCHLFQKVEGEVASVFESKTYYSYIKTYLNNGKILEATPEHIYYAYRNSNPVWLRADELKKGDCFIDPNGSWVKITYIKMINYPEGKRGLNLELKDGLVPIVAGVVTHKRRYRGV